MKVKKSLISYALIFCMLMTGLSFAYAGTNLQGQQKHSFQDIEGHWCSDVIEKFVEKNWILGYDDGLFRPDKLVTRAEFTAMVVNIFKETVEEVEDLNFSDVKKDDWFYDSIAYALSEGLVQGFDDRTFRPTENMSRQDAAVIVAKLFDVGFFEGANDVSFKDEDTFSEYSYKSIKNLASHEIIKGYPDGTFGPFRMITRAEAVKMLDVVLKYVDIPDGLIPLEPPKTPSPTQTPEPTLEPTQAPRRSNRTSRNVTPIQFPDEGINIFLENKDAKVGDIITARINIGGISNLAGYEINIKYDPDVLKPIDHKTKEPYKEDTVPYAESILSNENYVSVAYHDLNRGRINFGRAVDCLETFRDNKSKEVKGELARIEFKVIESGDTSIEFVDDKDNKYLRADANINREGILLFDWYGSLIETEKIIKDGLYNEASVINNSETEVSEELENEHSESKEDIEENTSEDYDDNSIPNNSEPELKEDEELENGEALEEYIIEGHLDTSTFEETKLEIFNENKKVIVSTDADDEGYFKIKYIPDTKEAVTLKISKEGYLDRFLNIPAGMYALKLGSMDKPLNMWKGDVNNDNIINMKDIMMSIKDNDDITLKKATDKFNRTPDDYPIEITLKEDTGKISDDIKVFENTVFNINGMNLTANSIKNSGKIHLNEGEIVLSGVYRQGRNVLSTEVPLIDMQNGKMEVSKDVIVNGGTMYINGGTLQVEGGYHLKNNAVLKMINYKDHVIVEDDMIIQTQSSYNGSLIAGTLELKGDFIIKETPNDNVFEADGTHKTVLAGEEGQTINMENGKGLHMFNMLILEESEDYYNFIPSDREFWRQMIVSILTEPEAPYLTGAWYNNTVRLYWSNENGADRYNIYRGSNDGGPYYLIEENRLRKDFIDIEVKEGNTYYYVVEAINRHGESPYSQQVKVSSEIVFDVESIDLDADYSGNGLTNREELEHGTNPFKWDTDEDGISDYDEIYVYGTCPLSPDTSGDGIYDGAAVKLGLDPTLQHENVKSQKSAVSEDGRVEVTIWGDANVVMSPLQIWNSGNTLLDNLEGTIGKTVEITNGGFPFEYAEIRVSYNREELGDIKEDELTIFHANPETQQLEEIDNVYVDKENQVIVGETTHFSEFIPGSVNTDYFLQSDIVFVLDQSASMRRYDPNDASVEATQRFIRNSFGFNNVNSQRIGLAGFDRSGYEKHWITDSGNRDVLLDILDGMRNPGGSATNITDGIRKGADMFYEHSTREKIIVLLTDGIANRENGMVTVDGERIRQELALAKELAKEGFVINTIALGTQTEADLLKAIADATGGRFYFIDNQEGYTQDDIDRQTSNVFQSISNSVLIDRGRSSNSKENSALPDPWNIRLIDEWWKGGKVEIRHDLNSELSEINPLETKDYGFTHVNVDRGEYERLFEDLKESQRGVFRSNEWIYLDDYDIPSDLFYYINPKEDIMVGRHEKKYYINPTIDANISKSAFMYYAQTVEASGGKVTPTYTVLNRVHYISQAHNTKRNDSNNEVYTSLNIQENFEVYYEPMENRIKLVNSNKGVLIENVKMGIQLDPDSEIVFESNQIDGVLKAKKSDLELIKPLASKIPYLGTIVEVWDYIDSIDKLINEFENESSSELGQQWPYATGTKIEDQINTYLVPIQFIAGQSKKRYLRSSGDFIKLNGLVKIYPSYEKDDFSAYVIVDFDVRFE
ncbi:S-layer homology domain-containing protein [Herbivorax sp. ANBcel31]|uniref:S-layer homology domain-containing protein n=1 Tax=Herbivorax sp. ANBcel31 TaxID=3069754 RepID=UPI0027B2EF71|nr:S-layer homology domain-containing protein [Herbivorax sp. ANBcel31]MDQ2087273.1 S-layer homology domain-containing protein [Herbivorax sp. ANBcel31]